MIALPGIVEDLFADGFEDDLLIGILIAIRSEVSFLVNGKLVVRPEGIVKCEIAVLVRLLGIEKSSHIAQHVHA